MLKEDPDSWQANGEEDRIWNQQNREESDHTEYLSNTELEREKIFNLEQHLHARPPTEDINPDVGLNRPTVEWLGTLEHVRRRPSFQWKAKPLK